ncbi:unnamed protein product [Linum trigynum]|uniref:Uncharacterized protein n=1 Tax=Linum trigynum TaxID=586398 RepID=A0AAV2CUF7_9ROSI
MPASESSLNTPSSGFCHTLPMLVDCMQREFFVHLLNSFLAFQIIPDFKTVGFCGWSLYPASPVAVVTRFTPLGKIPLPIFHGRILTIGWMGSSHSLIQNSGLYIAS